MLRLLRNSLVVLMLVAQGRDVLAFSLVGLRPAWQDAQLGYGWDVDGGVHTVGGPMNLGEEYRWNIPNIYYATDASFLNYFGKRGADEIDKAAQIINDLPPASKINIDDYPLKTQRVNYQAQALGLLDLKTAALESLVAEIGLTDPEAYIFTLRSRWIVPGGTNYYVIKRNFDPVTLQNSSYINGDLYTYVGIAEVGGGPDFPINVRVDPLGYGDPVASSESSVTRGSSPTTVGVFYTGLTRDDVGGLKYIYHPLNRNVENPPPNAVSGAGGGPVLATGGGGGGGSVWVPLLLNPTNGTITVAGGGGTVATSPWASVLVQNTNNNNNGTTTTTTGGQPTPAANNILNTGLRSGVDKLRLVKVEFDSILGQFVAPVVDGYTDTIVTNGTIISQSLVRVITQPDILFTAADLFTSSSSQVFLRMSRTDTLSWTNNGALNRPISDGLATPPAGPGTINPGVVITFNNAGPSFWNGPWPFFLSEDNPQAIFPIWGSFDGTTNAPVIYPNNVSIDDIERQVLGGL